MIQIKTVDQLAEQDWERVHIRFKEEALKEWDNLQSSNPVYFPHFLLSLVYQKWADYVRTN